MDLSITNLEAERQRRQIAAEISRIERLARSGGELPTPKIHLGVHRAERGAYIIFDSVKIYLDYAELGQDPNTKKFVARIYQQELEEELLKRFPDPIVTKKIYDHVIKAFEKDLATDGTIFERRGETKFCG